MRNRLKSFLFLCGFFLVLVAAYFIFPLFTTADAGEDITISTDTTWSAGEYTYQDITITNNATLTLEADTGTDTGVTINARNINIESGSSISADSQGYPAVSGTAPGTTWIGRGGGGAYGGNGGNASIVSGDSGLGGISFGSNFNPNSLGSGGGRDPEGGSGGGLIKLDLSGDLSVEGILSADGGDGTHGRAGGGSGGGIYIKADEVIGGGDISANGGSSPASGGGGGGGRIAIYYSSGLTLASENIIVGGGSGGGDSDRDGQAGSIFIFDSSSRNLTVDEDLSLTTNWGFDESGNPTSDGEYNLNNLTVTNNSTLILEGYHTDDSDGVGVTINLDGDLDVDSGSTISADEQGYSAEYGPGKGQTDSGRNGGAGYGGDGQHWRYGDIGVGTAGISYGNTMMPNDLGSGGGGVGYGGDGGGMVKILAEGSVDINGTMSANGGNGSYYSGSRGGGGSGGTVFIRADSVTGNGSIEADGGNGEAGGFSGGGSGGRVAIYSATISINSANISADAGTNNEGTPAEDGTIFLYNTTTGDVTVENDVTFSGDQGVNRDGTSRTDGVYYFNNLTISDSSTVTLESYFTDSSDGRGVTINLDGDLTLGAGSTITASGQGYTAGYGQGKGNWAGGLQSGSGGSYGGEGGFSEPAGNPTSPGTVYGENQKYYPYFLGSPGGSTHGADGNAATGGGAIAIRALGDIVINGDIKANGEGGVNGTSNYGGGGGSGGSIFMSANNFSGSGNIQANGGGLGVGNGFRAGGGGGGRISIAYFDSFTIDDNNVIATGGSGDGSDRDGSDGTVYIRKMELPEADFNLKNPNNNSTQYTNSRNVNIEPEDEDADEYYESSNGDPTPAFYISGWHKVSEGKQLDSAEGTKQVRAWIKDSNALISSSVGTANIVLDQTKPTINLSTKNSSTANSKIKIKGVIYDQLSGADYIQINGTSHSLSTNNFCLMMSGRENGSGNTATDQSFEADVSLANGLNTFTLIAFDRAGNSQMASLEITKEEGSQDSDQDPWSDVPEYIGGDEAEDDEIDSNGDKQNEDVDVGIVDLDKIEEDYDEDFDYDEDGNKLIFNNRNPVIRGNSDPEAEIVLVIDGQEHRTSADSEGNWSYQFSNLEVGEYSLNISEYTKEGELVRSQDYILEIKDQDQQDKSIFYSYWWLWLIILAIIVTIIYYYLKKKDNFGDSSTSN